MDAPDALFPQGCRNASAASFTICPTKPWIVGKLDVSDVVGTPPGFDDVHVNVFRWSTRHRVGTWPNREERKATVFVRHDPASVVSLSVRRSRIRVNAIGSCLVRKDDDSSDGSAAQVANHAGYLQGLPSGARGSDGALGCERRWLSKEYVFATLTWVANHLFVCLCPRCGGALVRLTLGLSFQTGGCHDSQQRESSHADMTVALASC